MGNNLSTFVVPDMSAVVLSAPDATADKILAGMWAGTFYVFGIIFTMFTLIDRWRGPHDKVLTEPSNVLQALIISLVWPVVMLYLMMSSG